MSLPLEVSDLRKVYRRNGQPALVAVDGISFTVSEGECFGLLGPNGAGKSSAMKCITGFYPPTEGRVQLLGMDVVKHPKDARRGLGVCHQEDTLDTDFRVLDQMIQFASFFGIERAEARRRALVLLERFGLMDKCNEIVETLSGGMRRRLQVARSLINHPRVLVLDEPTTGLDPEVRRALWAILSEERRKGLAILLSTHYMDEAERLCDWVAIMHQGRILACASPQTLIEREIGRDPVEEEVRPGVFARRSPNLEDVYLKLTGVSLSADGEEKG